MTRPDANDARPGAEPNGPDLAAIRKWLSKPTTNRREDYIKAIEYVKDLLAFVDILGDDLAAVYRDAPTPPAPQPATAAAPVAYPVVARDEPLTKAERTVLKALADGRMEISQPRNRNRGYSYGGKYIQSKTVNGLLYSGLVTENRAGNWFRLLITPAGLAALAQRGGAPNGDDE